MYILIYIEGKVSYYSSDCKFGQWIKSHERYHHTTGII